MDPWELFSEMCKQVVENGNVYLSVTICDGQIYMKLLPYEDDYFKNEEGDE